MDHLTTLLPELQIQVIEYLDYPSLVVLSQTSQYFRSIVQVQSPMTPQQKLSYIFVAENWRKNENHFACPRCLKIRPRVKFAGHPVMRDYWKGHEERKRRLCLQCDPPRRYEQKIEIGFNRCCDRDMADLQAVKR
ncbi:uncharacterized protein An15g05590 [Aspergillus niger]|uniref:Contig An15c0190, genomic contig n=2 Tax=Aspergillus niger TaxID=5061 RepID=A2R5U5_ASPNC|nr:uncharacterized protein An15g05590 [Aspergillus niger]CAK97344.1 unnamed protein product [Aspergillus niger]